MAERNKPQHDGEVAGMTAHTQQTEKMTAYAETPLSDTRWSSILSGPKQMYIFLFSSIKSWATEVKITPQ